MKQFAVYVVIVLALVLAILIAWNVANRPNGYEQAALVTAQGQARLDTGMAVAMLIFATFAGIGGLLLIIGGLVIAGMLINTTAATVAGIVAMTQQRQPPHIIERQIVLLPPPNHPRRETWQMLADSQAEVKFIPGKVGD